MTRPPHTAGSGTCACAALGAKDCGCPACLKRRRIISMRQSGATLEQIAAVYGVSRQRVQQQLKQWGYAGLRAMRDNTRPLCVVGNEYHEQWVGLLHVEQHGLPGRPAPRLVEPAMEPSAQDEEWEEAV